MSLAMVKKRFEDEDNPCPKVSSALVAFDVGISSATPSFSPCHSMQVKCFVLWCQVEINRSSWERLVACCIEFSPFFFFSKIRKFIWFGPQENITGAPWTQTRTPQFILWLPLQVCTNTNHLVSLQGAMYLTAFKLEILFSQVTSRWSAVFFFLNHQL